MAIHEWILLLPITFTLYLIIKSFLTKLKNRPPTPFLNFPLIGHLYLLKKPLHRTLAKISNRYGPVTLLQFGSRRVLVVSSSSAAEECLTKNDIVFANRPHLIGGQYLGYNFTTLVWSSYGEHWRNLRKISSIELLSNQRLQMLQGIRVDEVKSMIRRLDGYAREGRLIDMKSVFFELTMNVVMRMIAGKRYYGDNVEEVHEAKRFRKIVMDTLRIGGSNIRDFLPMVRWFGVSGVEKQLVDLQKNRDEFMQGLVEECKKEIKSNAGNCGDGENSKTMIEIMLQLQEKEPEYYTDQLIRSLMLTLFTTGTDTSAGTIEWALSLLLNNRQVLKKAQTEITEQIGNDRLIDESDIASLPYLRCIVNETLRMYPAGPLLVPHESSQNCSIGGYHVPAGTMLMVNVWAIQNDPKNWEDPEKFKPERFKLIEGTRDGFKFMPFGYGRRSCPGEGLAIRNVGLALGSVIQCFDWEIDGKDFVDMTETLGLTLPKAEPLMAYCKARPVVAKLLSQI